MTLYQAHRGSELVVVWARDCATLKLVVSQLGVEEALARQERFFKSSDPWIRGTDYGVGAFVARVNRLSDMNGAGANGARQGNAASRPDGLSAELGFTPSPRTQRVLRAGQEWLRMTEGTKGP